MAKRIIKPLQKEVIRLGDRKVQRPTTTKDLEVAERVGGGPTTTTTTVPPPPTTTTTSTTLPYCPEAVDIIMELVDPPPPATPQIARILNRAGSVVSITGIFPDDISNAVNVDVDQTTQEYTIEPDTELTFTFDEGLLMWVQFLLDGNIVHNVRDVVTGDSIDTEELKYNLIRILELGVI
jgi:hypothetical protein